MTTVARLKPKADPAPQLDRLLSLKDAAKLLGISERSLYHRVERRTVPFRKLGRRVVFSERDLLAFIAELPRFEATE